jgi:hypothetical protein
MATITGTFNSLVSGTISGVIGTPGPQGNTGPQGPQGEPGQGVPVGGVAGQVLAKVDGQDFNTEWVDQSGGGSAVWGDITGLISDQTDLQGELDAKYDASNPSNFITSAALAGYATQSWVTAGFYPLTGNPSGFITSSALTAYLSKAGNLAGLTSLSTARDNLNLGTNNSPTFSGLTALGSGGNVAQLTPTSLTLTQPGYGIFTFQPSQGIVFPDATIQTTAFNTSLLSAYLLKAGGTMTGDIQSNNNSAYRSWNGTYNTAVLKGDYLQLTNSDIGGNSLTVEWNGITFPSGKQTVHYPGASILDGFATESWVTSQGYLTNGDGGTVPAGGVTGQVLAKASSSDYSLVWESFIPGDRYLTSSTTSLAIDNANKTLTIGTGLSYTTQQDVIIAYDAAHHMHARVTTYNSSTGVMEVDVISHTGTGTFAVWTVNVGGTVPLGSVAWGDITGTIGSQSDLATELNAKFDHAGGAIDANGSITASDTSTATDSELAGWGLGVQLTADHTKGTTVEFNGLDTYDGASHMQVTPTGLTFPDSTVQTTAGGAAVTNNNQLATTVQNTSTQLYLSSSDRNSIIVCQTGSSGVVLTDSSYGWSVGQQVLIVNNTSSFISVQGSSVTVLTVNSATNVSPNGVCAAVYIDTNLWVISGSLTN